jgi:N-acetylglucosaminyldiphosphoundecaprenol N-acetyl-beta-D-mannosaminyltransferase
MIKNKLFEEIVVLGTRFHKVSVCQLLNYIVQCAKLNKKTVIGHVNTRAMNLAHELPWYKSFFNKADLVFCDGFGVLLGAKMLGYSVQSFHRMTCPDYIENLILACEQHNVSLFLLAGQPGVADKAIAQMTLIAPRLRVAGHHGHFEKSGQQNNDVIEKINQFKPDVLYIGFGMPLQERWIIDNFDQLEVRVFLPLGACLDFYTGNVSRGPRWMTNRGLEWLSRLIVEPNRLWKRYIVGNPLFFYRILKQAIAKYLKNLPFS